MFRIIHIVILAGVFPLAACSLAGDPGQRTNSTMTSDRLNEFPQYEFSLDHAADGEPPSPSNSGEDFIAATDHIDPRLYDNPSLGATLSASGFCQGTSDLSGTTTLKGTVTYDLNSLSKESIRRLVLDDNPALANAKDETLLRMAQDKVNRRIGTVPISEKDVVLCIQSSGNMIKAAVQDFDGNFYLAEPSRSSLHQIEPTRLQLRLALFNRVPGDSLPEQVKQIKGLGGSHLLNKAFRFEGEISADETSEGSMSFRLSGGDHSEELAKFMPPNIWPVRGRALIEPLDLTRFVTQNEPALEQPNQIEEEPRPRPSAIHEGENSSPVVTTPLEIETLSEPQASEREHEGDAPNAGEVSLSSASSSNPDQNPDENIEETVMKGETVQSEEIENHGMPAGFPPFTSNFSNQRLSLHQIRQIFCQGHPYHVFFRFQGPMETTQATKRRKEPLLAFLAEKAERDPQDEFDEVWFEMMRLYSEGSGLLLANRVLNGARGLFNKTVHVPYYFFACFNETHAVAANCPDFQSSMRSTENPDYNPFLDERRVPCVRPEFQHRPSWFLFSDQRTRGKHSPSENSLLLMGTAFKRTSTKGMHVAAVSLLEAAFDRQKESYDNQLLLTGIIEIPGSSLTEDDIEKECPLFRDEEEVSLIHYDGTLSSKYPLPPPVGDFEWVGPNNTDNTGCLSIQADSTPPTLMAQR